MIHSQSPADSNWADPVSTQPDHLLLGALETQPDPPAPRSENPTEAMPAAPNTHAHPISAQPASSLELGNLLWDFLEEASYDPLVPLSPVWGYLDRLLPTLPFERQMVVIARTIETVSQLYQSRSDRLLDDWEDRHNPSGPVVKLETLFDLVRESVGTDLESLFDPEEVHLIGNSTLIDEWLLESVGEGDEHASTAEPLDVESLPVPDEDYQAQLEQEIEQREQMAEQLSALPIESLSDLFSLAGNDQPSVWSDDIRTFFNHQIDALQRFKKLPQATRIEREGQEWLECPLNGLKDVLKRSVVEIWLGLLLGSYEIEQTGEFYNPQTIVVRYPICPPAAGTDGQ